MRFLLVVIAWFILLAVSWPLALAVMFLGPLLLLLALPLALAGIAFCAMIALVKALLFLPARVLGYRG